MVKWHQVSTILFPNQFYTKLSWRFKMTGEGTVEQTQGKVVLEGQV